MPFFPLLLLFAAIFCNVIGVEVRVSSVDGFNQLRDNANNGATYFGTTVFLDSDLSFPEGSTFNSIENTELSCFSWCI